MAKTPAFDRPLTFASDFLASLHAALERHDAAILRGTRLDRSDAAASVIARELDEPQLAHHVHALAAALGVAVVNVRAAVAREVASARVREEDARRAVQGGEP